MSVAKTFMCKPKSLPFRPRVQFIGTVNWLCAAYGKINREYLTPTAGWKIRCKARLCGAVFAIGWTFWQLLHREGQRRPLDSGLPAGEPFPQCETGTLGAARFIHDAVAEMSVSDLAMESKTNSAFIGMSCAVPRRLLFPERVFGGAVLGLD